MRHRFGVYNKPTGEHRGNLTYLPEYSSWCSEGDDAGWIIVFCGNYRRKNPNIGGYTNIY